MRSERSNKIRKKHHTLKSRRHNVLYNIYPKKNETNTGLLPSALAAAASADTQNVEKGREKERTKRDSNERVSEQKLVKNSLIKRLINVKNYKSIHQIPNPNCIKILLNLSIFSF